MTELLAEQRLPLRRLTCRRCGSTFECGTGGASGVCWCMDENVRLPMPDEADGDCLCPACLRLEASLPGRKA